jgi:hypothetical protein
LQDTTSVVYQEIANNQNLSSSHRYIIPESNRVLHFFLADPQFTYRNNTYKPIGDYAVNYLNELARDPANDPYNRAMGNFRESGALNSPLYVIVQFFDIMVEEALHQGVEWHMWLYYMPPVVERIARNYRIDVDPMADPDDEWPIRYSFLLYTIFSALCNWTEGLEDVPLDQANVILKSTRADHENGNIPKSSILALCECGRWVLESDNLTVRFKRYLMDMVFTLYFDLRLNDKLLGYTTVLRNAIEQGGTHARRKNQKYRDALVAAFEAEKSEYYIKYPDAVVEELEAAIQ